MIEYQGYAELIACVYEFGQEHVFTYWNELTAAEKKDLIQELAAIDFPLMKKLYGESDEVKHHEFSPAPFIHLHGIDEQDFPAARKAGAEHIASGKTAAFLVAGGQGSRLGFDGPKGKFPIGPVSGKTLFHFHGEKIRKAELQYSTTIPFLVMTSKDNHEETVDFFRKEKFFGLKEENVHIFRQNMIPSIDMKGRLILSSKSSIFMNPDGHGGSLYALNDSGILKTIRDQGIETLSYFQVDNPLVNIIDPLFIGFHIMKDSQVSSKALIKAYPEEKTGVFVEFPDGKTGIIEYSDMTNEQLHQRGPDGNLLYSAGNPAIHLFSTSFITGLTGRDQGMTLPFHRAVKKISAFKNGTAGEIEGYKFEKFVFDALPLAERSLILETKREDEFAPVKNASGKDSPESASEMMHSLYCRWLKNEGITVPESVKILEISPLLSADGSGFPKKLNILPAEKVYLK